MLLVAIFLCLNFKAAFVRQDSGHVALFFADALVLFAVLCAPHVMRGRALTAAAVSIVMVAAAHGTFDVGQAIDPVQHARNAIDQTRTLATGARREALRASFVTRVRQEVPIPDRLRALVGDRTVSAWPNSQGSALYAYGLNWRPIVTSEPYALYTPRLDALAARQLASERAPERVLRTLDEPIDRRFAAFEAPRATLALLCRFRELGRDRTWQVLAVADDRCGSPRALRTVEAPWGEAVEVPRASRDDMLVRVKVDGTRPAGLERLRALGLRPRTRFVELGDSGFRLVEATAADGLLVHAPADADFRPPFNVVSNVDTITVVRDGGNPGGTLRYSFEEIPVRPLRDDRRDRRARGAKRR